MKRVNYDELIWFIMLVILNFLMFMLIQTGKIENFLNGRMLILFKISLCIISIFSLCQLSKIFTIRSRTYITNKFLPLLIFIIILSIYILYPEKHNEFATDSFDDINIITENIYLYEGENLYFKGFIYKDKEDPSNIYLCREKLTCCQYDSRLIKIPLINIEEEFDNNTWVIIYGTVLDNNGLVINVVDCEKSTEPEDRFLKVH